MTAQDAKIEAHAKAFRKALDRADWAALPIPYHEFPRGSCGAVCEVLNRFLTERVGVKFQQASGTRTVDGDRCSHAWLELDGLIVDITSDQFGLPPFVVSYDSPWHRGFGDVERHFLPPDPAWWSEYGAPVWRLVEHILVPL